MQRGKIGGRKSLETGFIAVDINGEGMVAKEQLPQPLPAEGDDIVGVFLQRGELGGALGRKRGALESGPQHRVGQQIKRPRQVRRQHFDGEPEAVVSRDRIKRPADLLDGPRDLGGRAPLRVLGQQGCQQFGGAAATGRLMERAAQEQEPQVQVGQPRLGLQEEPGAVGQGRHLEVAGGGPVAARVARRAGLRVRRIDGHGGEPRGHQMSSEHAAQIGGRERPQAFKIGTAVFEIADHDLGDSQARGLAGHGLAGVDLAHHGLTDRLREEFPGKAPNRAARELLFNAGGGRFAFAGVTGERNQEQAGGAGIPGMGVDGVHQPRPFAHGLPQDRAVAAAQDRSEHVERRRVRMRETGDLPGKISARELHVLEQMLLTTGQLERLAGQRERGEPRTRDGAKVFFDGGARGSGLKGADHHEHEIVGHIARVVVRQEVIARDGGKHVAVTDDRMAIRMLAEGGRKKHLAEPVIRVVLPHVNLAQDDVAFANHLVGGQRGVQHGISEHINGHASMLGRDVDVIHRAVEGRVGVKVAAMRLDGQGDFATRAPLGALEQHVFEKMGETRP